MDKTLIKGVQVLETLLLLDRPCGVSELARLCVLNPSNVHRTLQTWLQLGFVAQQADSGEYRCTLKLFEWGCRAADGLNVRAVAHDFLVRLAVSTQETIHLSVLDGSEVVYLDKIDSPQPVRAYSAIGGRAPAHCVATGKVLLAHGGHAALRNLPIPLPRPTKNSLESLDALEKQLEKIRSQGYAANHAEWRSDVCGLGVAIFDHHEQAVAAIGLSAPSTRFGRRREREFARLMMETADEVSVVLGGESGHEHVRSRSVPSGITIQY